MMSGNKIEEANRALDEGSYSKAFELYQSMEDDHNSDILRVLAWMYLWSAGTSENPTKALELFLKASEVDPDDLELLFGQAKCYFALNKFDIAMRMYVNLIEEKDYPPANYNLGMMYEKGVVVEKDIDMALFYYGACAKQKHMYGAKQQGRLLLRGERGFLYRFLGFYLLAKNLMNAVDIMVRGDGFYDARLLK